MGPRGANGLGHELQQEGLLPSLPVAVLRLGRALVLIRLARLQLVIRRVALPT
jgi:hypothetical protein